MQWLTALLAFATTMLMFAIVVSTLVEMIHRIWGMRGQGMRLMLENLYTRVIEPKLTGDRPTPAQFATWIMENRAVAPREGESSPGRLGRFLRWLVDSSVMTDIPVEVFTQKLADNRIVGAADAFTDEVVKDIAQKYEAFGKEAGTYFERRARLFSVIVAFFVAWMFYVHPYNLAVAYIKNPDLAQRVADKAADVQADYAVLMEKLNEAGEDGAAESGDLQAAIKDLDEELKNARKQTRELQAFGVPVGWPDQTTLAACDRTNLADICTFTVFGDVWTKPSIQGAFWLLLGGLLVGLGAPFWAQAVSSLTASRDVTNRIAAIVTPERVTHKGVVFEAAPAAPRVTTEPTSVATFRVARTSQPQG